MSKSESTLPPISQGRREQFEAEIAAVRIRTGKGEEERRFLLVGLVTMGVGAALCLIAYFASRGLGDSRDILTYVLLALFGISLTIGGAALFLRYSMARFLRFWLLRLIYEQQDTPAGK